MPQIRKSSPADRSGILALMAHARGNHLSEAERSEQGFVQGTMDEAILERFESGPGIFVAEVDGKLAGFAMTSNPGQATHNAPAVRALELAAEDGPTLRRFLYGPAAVSPDFQGQGILSGLLADLSLHLQEQFDQGVAFVDHANEKSLAVHRHFGMSALSSFELNGSLYTAFIFHPKLFADRLA